ncbi:MAG: DNRLRE domain-containing protein [Planctomycetaceae bacterium]
MTPVTVCRRTACRWGLGCLLAALSGGPVAAQSVVLSGSVVGATPATIGYNSGDFTNNQTASWWRYSGANGGRLFSAPATITPDSLFRSSTNAALDATTQALFESQRAALRASGTNTTYIRWSTAYNSYYSQSIDYGANTIDMEFADSTIRGAGGTSLVVMQRSPNTYPWPATAASNSASDWQARWLGWQQWYAQAYIRARYNDVSTFQFFNEPDLYSTGTLTQAQWIQMVQYGADAVQAAVADVNSTFGKNLVAKVSAPVTNGPTLTPSGTGGDWGDTLLAYRNTPVLSATAVPGYQLFNQYDYHNYGSSPTTFGTKLEGAIADVNAQTGGQADQYSFTLSEYNTRTSADYATSSYTPDSLAMSSRLGQIDVNLANAGADGLYLFKFSNSGGANNGVHWQSTSGTVGGASRSAMVHQLFAEGFTGNSLLAKPTISGTVISLAAALNATTGTRYVLAANANLTSGTSLTIDLSPWSTPEGSVVTVKQVSNLHQGDISQSITVGSNRTITVDADPGGVVLVRVPSFVGSTRTTLLASADAYVNQASGTTTFNGTELLVQNSGTTAAQRNVAYLKFAATITDTTQRLQEATLSIYARDPGAVTSGSAGIITHVYGITSSTWSQSSITWNTAPNLGQPAATISTIDQNYVTNVGTSAEIVGQFAASSTEGWLSIDVSDWVLDRLSKGETTFSFLVARQIRFDGDVDASQWLSIRSAEYGDGSYAPQLTLVVSPEPSTAALAAAAGLLACWARRRRRR